MGNGIREIDYADMEKFTDENARDKFKRPAYQVRKLIREQGTQIEHCQEGGDAIE